MKVTDSGARRLFKVPKAQSAIFNGTGDWRAERWSGENCVVLSMIHSDASRPEAEQRGYAQVKLDKGEWRLSPTTAKLGCVVKT